MNAPLALTPMQQAIIDLRTLRARLQASETKHRGPIAITGMACRFPGGADDLAAFWRLLDDEVDAIGDLPSDRWDIDAWYDPDPDVPGRMSTRYGGFLRDIDAFDAEFFGISDREAVSVDPQHRLLLEAGWSAFEDAGLAFETMFGSSTGVFVGISSFDYASLRAQGGDLAQMDAYHATGIAHSAGAGRLAYYFGLQGPAISIDTACSSSLVAIHLACQSLRSGECDTALAGGINLILSPEIHVTLSKAKMMAPDGRCKAFDAAADGFVRSEGCGMLVLKRLADALRDGDRIHAVIRGSACNQDGRSSGLAAPNGPSQTAVVKAAWAAAGVEAKDVDYVEAHGTGTALGDPIEAGALSAALRDAPEGHVLAIGSVKTNLGHMEAAAGVAGVIKTALALRHEQIPASLHFKQGSPNIDWRGSRLKVVAKAMPWLRSQKPRLAGISSFGFSGTNVHIVIEEPPLPPVAVGTPSATRIFAISATNAAALAEVAGRLAVALRAADLNDGGWPLLSRSVNARRSHHLERAAWVAASPAEAAANLDALARGEPAPAMLRGQADPMRKPPIAFAAGDVPCMPADPRADELYATSPPFRETIDACNGWSSGFAPSDDLRAFAIQWALAQTWRAWSGPPVAASGRGVGAFVAACVGGILAPEDAIALVALRRSCLDTIDPARRAVALTAFREMADRTQFAPSPLSPPGAALIGADYWVAEMASTRAGMITELCIGHVGAAIVLDLTPESSASLRTTMLHDVARLYVRGAAIDWQSVEEPAPGQAADLPGYPWTRQTYWFPKAAPAAAPVDAWATMVAATNRQAELIPIDLQIFTYAAKYRALDKLSSAYILRTLGDLGALAPAKPVLSAQSLIDRYGVLPIYRQLLEIWLNKLAGEGRLEKLGEDFAVVHPPLIPEPVATLEAEAQMIFADAPVLLEYVKGCGALLTQVIRGETSPLETLFPNGQMELAEGLYHRAALSRYFNGIVGAAAASFAAARPGPFRVIEVGGGTGGVTGAVLAGLPAERSRYVFTDVSSFFFEPAQRRFAEFGFVDFAVLDLEQAPQSQGFAPGTYDLVVAANVLHATADLGQTLDFARSLLVPGGALLLYEVTHPPSYFDVSIALIEGWQLAHDNIREIGPLIDTDKWRALLPRHGFDLVEVWPDVDSAAEVLGSHVFMARANGSLAENLSAKAAPAPDRKAFAVIDTVVHAEDDICEILAETPDSEHRGALIDFVRRRVSAVLKRPEGSNIPIDRRLMDLGLDSLMALELRNALARDLRLGDALPATLMFDHPSIADIADFLIGRLQAGAGDSRPAAAGHVDPSAAAGHVAKSRPASSQLTAADVEAFSDADIERLLAERLGSGGS